MFCSASNDIDPLYNRAAGEFVRRACAKGYEIVSGGTVKGTMGVISKAVEECGGKHVGILPRFMEAQGEDEGGDLRGSRSSGRNWNPG